MAETQSKDQASDHDQIPDLGKLLAHYPVEGWGWKRWTLVIFGGVLMVGSLIAIIYLGFEADTAIQRHGRAVLLRYLPMPFTPIVLLFPLGGVFVLTAWLTWQNGITLYEKGIHHQKGKRSRFWLWEEFVRLDTRVVHVRFSGSTIASYGRILLEDQNNRQWTVRNHYQEMDQLINKIRLKVLPIIYQKMVERLIDGEAIAFNKNLQAIRNGLKINGEFSPWRILDMPETSKGIFLLKHKETQEVLFKSRVDQIVNLDSLIHLIKNPPPSTGQFSPK